MDKAEKSCFGRRLVKFMLWGIAGFTVFAVLLALSLPLWISPVATCVAGKIVPGYTGTDFRIESFRLNPYSGTLSIRGIKLSNPDGFGEAAAFSLSGFDVKVDVGSLLSDTILVKDVQISDTFVSYYSHGGKNNFDVILENVDRSMGPKEEKKSAGGEKEAPPKKVIIERLYVAGTKVKFMKSDLMPAIALPTVELKDIGRKSGGASLKEAWAQISASVMNSMGSVNDGLGALGGILGDGAKGASGTVVESVSDTAKSAVDSVGGTTRGTVDAVSDTTRGTVDAVSDMTKGTVDAVSDTTKRTVDAVSDTTKKAAEGVKNLFKGLGK